ncbi:MAG: heavy-metal-associated domain-containing protein [Pseudonocardiaceae bacterium]
MGETATISEYVVTGMVCQHCVSAVTEEVGAIAGVSGVQVELATGRLSVTSNVALDDTAVHAAVNEAGYEISR